MKRPSDAKDRARALWGERPAGSALAPNLEPGTKEFFETVLAARSAGEHSWLSDVVPFQALAGKRVLEIGCGAGYDAFCLCENKALYVGIDLAVQNARRTRIHLAPYGHRPDVAAADAESLPFRAQSFEAAFSNGVLHHTPHFERALCDIARALRPEARFWLIVYHRNSVFYWLTLFLFDHVLRGGFRKRSFAERLSMIENPDQTALGGRPLVMAYSRRALVRLLQRAGFSVETVRVRKLAREDLPDLGPFGRLWRFVPDAWLATVGRHFGWYLIAQVTRA